MTDKAEEPRRSEPLFDFSRWVFTLDDKSLVRVEELTKAGWKFAQVQIGDKTVLYPVKVPDKHPQIDIAAPVRSEEPLSVRIGEAIEAWGEDLADAESERKEIADFNCYGYGYVEGQIEVTKRAIEQFRQLAALASHASYERETVCIHSAGHNFTGACPECPASAEVRAGAPPQCGNPEITVTYTNHKGVTAERRIIPQSIRFGFSQWHRESQWLMEVFDVGKGQLREFAMRDIRFASSRPAASPLEPEVEPDTNKPNTSYELAEKFAKVTKPAPPDATEAEQQIGAAHPEQERDK